MPHTPGPWKISPSTYPNGYFINAVVTSEEQVCNKDLMEAAPDLLKVCQTFCGFNYKTPEAMAKWVISLVEAVQKATGKQRVMLAQRDEELKTTIVTNG